MLGAETELHSIFQNLISNAAKYTPPQGRIGIRWWMDDAGGHVAVTTPASASRPSTFPDSPSGFTASILADRAKLGGSGLGLAIVKHALQRHAGRLEIESEEGRGSTFTCHFPVARVIVAAPRVIARVSGAYAYA